jgi:predicted RNase H-like HicB family nuclease
MVNFRVIIEKDEDGILVARVPDLPGCATEGKTRAELMKNLKEAIQAYLESPKGTQIEPELRPEVIKSLKTSESEKTIRVKDFTQRYSK